MRERVRNKHKQAQGIWLTELAAVLREHSERSPVSAQRRAAQQHAHTVRAAPAGFAQRARRGDDSRSTTCRRRHRRRRRRRPSAGAGSRGRCVLQETTRLRARDPSLQRDFSAEPQVHGAVAARRRGAGACGVRGDRRGWWAARGRWCRVQFAGRGVAPIGASRSPSSSRQKRSQQNTGGRAEGGAGGRARLSTVVARTVRHAMRVFFFQLVP